MIFRTNDAEVYWSSKQRVRKKDVDMQSEKIVIPEKYDSENPSKFSFPKRYVIIILGFLGMFNVYAMRVNLSVAMVAMVNQTTSTKNGTTHQVTECSNLIDYDQQTSTQTFKALSFYGYIITQLPGGILSEKFGSKWLFGCGILVTSVLSLLTPLAASWGKAAFITVRVLEGLGEGVTFPAINFAIGTWAPKTERSRFSTIIFTGSQIGNVIAMPVSGWLSSTTFLGGWPSVFYVFGFLGCVWFAFWSFLMYESPDIHPHISKEELIYIKQNKDVVPKKRSAIPWKSIFTSVPMWALIFAHFGHNFGFLILLTELPTYLSTILHFNVKENGFLSALPYISQAISAWIASFIADKLRESNKMTITTIRKVSNSIGLFGPAICLLAVTVSGCRPELIVALFSMAMALNGFIYSGFNITHVDMGPDFAGTTFAITNAISNFSGILGPMIVGAFTASGATIANWSNVFYIAAAVYTICGVVFAIFGSAELQHWGLFKSESESKEKFSKKVNLVNIIS